MLQLSGVVTILFSGISSRRYISRNISLEAKRSASFIFELTAYVCETAVFLCLGMAVLDKEKSSSFKPAFLLWALVLCLLARAAHVYPLLSLVNVYRRGEARRRGAESTAIPTNAQHM
eukprot:gene8885-11402_t